jgi:heme exporter protein A
LTGPPWSSARSSARSSASPAFDAVRTRGLGRIYDDDYALVGLDATFPAGTLTALLGPNGAGKSTLMGILSTLMRPSEGEVLLGETPVGHAPAGVRGRIGYVGHRTFLYRPLSARENLRFFGRLYGVVDLDARVEALLAAVGLARDAERAAGDFSRGMAQRLTLARALLPAPDLLLLDEPLTGLDRAGVAMAVRLIGAERDRGAVVVMASHDLEATDQLADRALILRRGRKVFEGPVTAGIPGGLASLYHETLGSEQSA